MGFKKPFRAIPVRLGPYYKAEQRRRQSVLVAKVLGAAAAGGLTFGFAGALYADGEVGTVVHDAAVSLGLQRKNTPMPGAYYPGCAEARAAGVAPLYLGEPGYRVGMDGDGDGIACEPRRA